MVAGISQLLLSDGGVTGNNVITVKFLLLYIDCEPMLVTFAGMVSVPTATPDNDPVPKLVILGGRTRAASAVQPLNVE